MEMVSAPVVRDSKGRVVKGSTLNAGGYTTREARMLRDLRALGPRAIAKLGKLLDDPNASVALGAAKEILDRNLGKVKQQVQVDVTSTHVLHLQALEHLAERKRAQLLEAQSSQAIDITPVSVSTNPNITLDRIGLHEPSDAIDASVTILDVSATVEAPRPPEAPGAAAYAPTPPATDENPTTEPDKTT
jgi:hypothetical protein